MKPLALEKDLDNLLTWQQITYGAAVVSRMLQNYHLFCEVSDQGDVNVFRNILALVWEFASGQNEAIDFLRQQDKLESIVPDPEQFDGYGVWPALDATTALCALISACHKMDIEEIHSVHTLSRSTIEQYLVASRDSESVEFELDSHPLIQADDAFNLMIIQQLQEDNEIKTRKDSVASIKNLVNDLDSSNIGLGCPP